MGAGFPALPVRINSAPDTLNNDQFMPWMAINSQGVIAVVFYSKLDNVTPFARVDAATMRKLRNVGEGEAVYVCVGGKDGYVGRDGRAPEGDPGPRARPVDGAGGAG